MSAIPTILTSHGSQEAIDQAYYSYTQVTKEQEKYEILSDGMKIVLSRLD